MTLCTLRVTTVLSRDCRADFGRPLTKKVMSHSRDGPGVTAPSRTNIVPLTRVWNTSPSVTPPPLKSPRNFDTARELFPGFAAAQNVIPGKSWALSNKNNGWWTFGPAFGNAPGFSCETATAFLSFSVYNDAIT